MSDLLEELRAAIPALTSPDDQGRDPDHDPTNGRWLEQRFAETLQRWGYRTTCNEYLFGLETDVIARRDELRGEPADFIVGECKDWQTRLVGRDTVADISHRAALARAMPVLVVGRGVTTAAWNLAQRLDVRILTYEDLQKDSLRPLTEHRPPRGTLRTRRAPGIREFREPVPLLLTRRGPSNVEAPMFNGPARGPCYVPDRAGNDEYVTAYDCEYEFDLR
ncbi:hypothetical protein JCM17823_10760 [Halorubrum gandharaense]